MTHVASYGYLQLIAIHQQAKMMHTVITFLSTSYLKLSTLIKNTANFINKIDFFDAQLITPDVTSMYKNLRDELLNVVELVIPTLLHHNSN